jgi:hypothetical protein
MTVVDVNVNSSMFTYTLVWNIFRVERIDGIASGPESIEVKFKDQWNAESESLTITLNNFDDF